MAGAFSEFVVSQTDAWPVSCAWRSAAASSAREAAVRGCRAVSVASGLRCAAQDLREVSAIREVRVSPDIAGPLRFESARTAREGHVGALGQDVPRIPS